MYSYSGKKKISNLRLSVTDGSCNWKTSYLKSNKRSYFCYFTTVGLFSHCLLDHVWQWYSWHSKYENKLRKQGLKSLSWLNVLCRGKCFLLFSLWLKICAFKKICFCRNGSFVTLGTAATCGRNGVWRLADTGASWCAFNAMLHVLFRWVRLFPQIYQQSLCGLASFTRDGAKGERSRSETF